MKTLQECKEEAARVNHGAEFKFVHQAYSCSDETRAELLGKCTDAAAELYADQFKPKWISVTESLPDCINILAYSGGLKLTLTYIDGEYWTEDGCLWCSPVTHWMPLPDQPID